MNRKPMSYQNDRNFEMIRTDARPVGDPSPFRSSLWSQPPLISASSLGSDVEKVLQRIRLPSIKP
jgi:hypothetical protein